MVRLARPANSLVCRGDKFYVALALNGGVFNRLHLLPQNGDLVSQLFCAIQNCRQYNGGLRTRNTGVSSMFVADKCGCAI
jgi:hypothetical protein